MSSYSDLPGKWWYTSIKYRGRRIYSKNCPFSLAWNLFSNESKIYCVKLWRWSTNIRNKSLTDYILVNNNTSQISIYNCPHSLLTLENMNIIIRSRGFIKKKNRDSYHKFSKPAFAFPREKKKEKDKKLHVLVMER